MSDTSAQKQKTEKALEAKVQEIRSDLNEWNQGDVRGRHRIGKHIAGIKDNAQKYGIHAVEKIAKEIGYSDSWLYDCASVAETWTDREIERLLKRMDQKRDQPLSWTHLVLISEIDDKKKRKSWVDDTLQNGWTVRELKAQMNQEPEFDDSDPGQASRPTLRWLANIQAIAESDVSKQQQWGKTLFSLDGPGIEITSAEDKDSLDQAIEAVENARKGYTELLRQLRRTAKQTQAEIQEATV